MKNLKEALKQIKEEMRGWSPQIGQTKGLTPKTLNKILMKVASGEDWEPDNEIEKKLKEAFLQLQEEKPGLWANIRAKRARGEKPAHKNSNAHKDAVKAGKKINAMNELSGEQREALTDNKLTVISVIDGKRNLDNDQIRQLFDDSTGGTFYIYTNEEDEYENEKPISKQEALEYIKYYNSRIDGDSNTEERLGAKLGVLGIESELRFNQGEFRTDPSAFSANENYDDGKVKGKSRPGRVKKSGASCKGSVTDLRAKAKKYGGEKGKMYHWCANMKSGRKKQ